MDSFLAHKPLPDCFSDLRQIKTLQHASLLYSRAATEGQYKGRTRADFHNLHQSVHEFRIIDRSKQHSQEIDEANREVPRETAVETPMVTETFGFDDQSLDTNTLLNQLLAEVSTNVDEQGAWSQWWPPMEEVELPPTEQGMPMLL